MTASNNSISSFGCHCPGCKKTKERAPDTSHEELKDQILFKQLRSCGPVAPKSPAERAQAAL